MKGWDESAVNYAKQRKESNNEATKANRAAVANHLRKAVPSVKIGIDPSFRKGGLGVCVIDETGEAHFKKFKGRGLVDFVKWMYWEAPEKATVTIENSNLQNKTFDMRGTKAAVARKSRNVGCNQATSEYFVDFCIDKYGKENVNSISPRTKGKKWTKAFFGLMVKSNKHKLTGYTGTQDQIDAYQLATR